MQEESTPRHWRSGTAPNVNEAWERPERLGSVTADHEVTLNWRPVVSVPGQMIFAWLALGRPGVRRWS